MLLMAFQWGPPPPSVTAQSCCLKGCLLPVVLKLGTRPTAFKTSLNQKQWTSISEIQIGSDLCVSTSTGSWKKYI